MKPFGAQENEQSGVGCKVDPRPRPDLIRDSLVHCSAGGAFTSVALENLYPEGVKKELVENKQGEDVLGLRKESDETTELATNIADSSGSSWKQGSQSIWNRLSRIRSGGGWFYKMMIKMLYLLLCLLHVSKASGDSCVIESAVPGCYGYFPYQQVEVRYGKPIVLATFPGELYVVKIKWITGSKLKDIYCGNMADSNCSISILDTDKTNSCHDLYPVIPVTIQPNGTVYQEVTATVTEEAQYCIAVDARGHFGVYQGGVFPITTPTAPITCPALDTEPLATQTGCDPEPQGRVASGSVCTFSCPSGYEGKGDVHKMCLGNGTWTSIDFTCQGNNTSVNGWMVSTIILLVVISVIMISVLVVIYRNPWEKTKNDKDASTGEKGEKPEEIDASPGKDLRSISEQKFQEDLFGLRTVGYLFTYIFVKITKVKWLSGGMVLFALLNRSGVIGGDPGGDKFGGNNCTVGRDNQGPASRSNVGYINNSSQNRGEEVQVMVNGVGGAS